jgi:GAF domain-containing protein
MRVAGKILGVIELVNKDDSSEFTESDAMILSLLAVFAAISLDQLDRQLAAQEMASS